MKKTLIALAALAAFGTASAEVTLYGKVDLGISNNKTDGKDDAGVQVTANNYESSRFGIKGSTNLSTGIKGFFQVESKFDAANGNLSKFRSNGSNGSLTAEDGVGFGRVAKLGIQGSFGTVSAGLDWTPYDNAWTDALEYNGFSAASAAFYSGVHGDNGNNGRGNASGMIQYATNDMNGFNAVFMVAPSKTTADNSTTPAAVTIASGTDTTYYGLGLNYAKGPLVVQFATEHTPNYVANAGVAGNTDAWILTGSYDLNVAKVSLQLERANASGIGKDSGYGLGVSIPVAAKTTFALGYAYEKVELQNSNTAGSTQSLGAQVVYAVTDAAAVYVGARKTTVSSVNSSDTGTNDTNSNIFAAGLRYNF